MIEWSLYVSITFLWLAIICMALSALFPEKRVGEIAELCVPICYFSMVISLLAGLTWLVVATL